uniref:Uncharacterized protein LOC114328648 n=1 Tax=Diabrotica virgifera virgifera TaxID=50390 RepID=A0A6P7FBR7_DIAVI
MDDPELEKLIESNSHVFNEYVVVDAKIIDEDIEAPDTGIRDAILLDNGQVNNHENGERVELEEVTINEQGEEEIMTNADLNLYTKKGKLRKRKTYQLSVLERKKAKMAEKANAHYVQGTCASSNCKIKCPSKISEDRQKKINNQFWAIECVQERKTFVLNSFSQMAVKRKTGGPDSRRQWTNEYFLKTEDGTKLQVCKEFFLNTLGYTKNNDKILQNMSKQKSQISPAPDKRKGREPPNKVNHDLIIEDINLYEPTISHHRREHAPNRRYLPSDLTIKQMHENFLKKNPNTTCSYDLYRSEVTKQNISFVKLGHEECEVCEHFNLHGHSQNDLKLDTCETCVLWNTHITKASAAREEYQKDANKGSNDECIIYSMDMEKVIMLPRCEMFKSVIFTKRLTVYNESFVPVGKKNSWPSVACLWHDAIRGRNKEELISTVHKFLSTHCRDVKRIILWMDNCSAQNKNWAFLTYLVFIINSDLISAGSIEIKYFEPGHTFMSCDSFHHMVEKSLHKAKKTYDFEDFKKAVQTCSSSSNVSVLEMNPTDFFMWKDLSQKIRKAKKKPESQNHKRKRGSTGAAENTQRTKSTQMKKPSREATSEPVFDTPQEEKLDQKIDERPLLKEVMLLKAQKVLYVYNSKNHMMTQKSGNL